MLLSTIVFFSRPTSIVMTEFYRQFKSLYNLCSLHFLSFSAHTVQNGKLSLLWRNRNIGLFNAVHVQSCIALLHFLNIKRNHANCCVASMTLCYTRLYSTRWMWNHLIFISIPLKQSYLCGNNLTAPNVYCLYRFGKDYRQYIFSMGSHSSNK